MSPAFAPWPALAGGALIGLAASAIFALHGRVAGVSGALGGLLARERDGLAFRVLFLAGLLAGGVALAIAAPSTLETAVAVAAPRSAPVLAAAGLLVGFGTRLGSGCTSGHGVCGVSRGSKRSMTATGIFMATAFATVFVAHHLLARGSR